MKMSYTTQINLAQTKPNYIGEQKISIVLQPRPPGHFGHMFHLVNRLVIACKPSFPVSNNSSSTQ